MLFGKVIISSLALVLLASMVFGGSGSLTLAKNPSDQTTPQAESQPQTTVWQQQPSPSSTPKPKPKDEEAPGQSDEVIRVETNLTNIFFTAEDKHKRLCLSSAVKKILVRLVSTRITSSDCPGASSSFGFGFGVDEGEGCCCHTVVCG